MTFGERQIRSDSDMEDRRTWALWGNRSEIVDGVATTLTSHGYGQSEAQLRTTFQEAIEDYSALSPPSLVFAAQIAGRMSVSMTFRMNFASTV